MTGAPLAGAGMDPCRPVGRLDARARVVAAMAVVAVSLTIRSPAVLAVLLTVALTGAWAGGVGWRRLGRHVLQVEAPLVVLAVMLPLTMPGPALVSLGPLALSWPGVERAGMIVLRVSVCAVAVLILLGGLDAVRLGHALARLGMPVRLVHLLLIAARYVTVIGDEAARIHESLRVRAFRPGMSAHGLRTLGHVIGQLLVRAFERGERIDEAMRCRGFSGRFALVDDSRFGRADLGFAAMLAAGLIAAVAADRWV